LKLNIGNEQKVHLNRFSFLILNQIIDPEQLPVLRQAFDNQLKDSAFRIPDNDREPILKAVQKSGLDPDIVYIQVPAVGGSFHHDWAWHGSGQNPSDQP
jgi:hypothetical protein